MNKVTQFIKINVETSRSFFLFLFKLLSGIILGLVVALIAQEILQFGVFSFTFTVTAITLMFLRVTRRWGRWGVVVFDIFAILIAMILRMYILMAPGA